MKKGSILIQLILLILLLVLSGCTTTNPDDKNENNIPEGLYVSLSGEKEFTSIQEAIDRAPENYTVYVFPGKYNETIIINKTINLIGEDPATTIIDGLSLGDVITITNSEKCNINGFTIQNSKSNGAGLEIKTKNNNISNNIIKNSYNGIHCNRANHNSFFNNTLLSNNNYAIYIYNANYNTAEKNLFSDNSYGMRIKGSRNNKVISNYFKDNDHGMYFCCGATSNVAYYNTFMNNSMWNANDYVGGNTWYNQDTSKGNYWDDYDGIDEDNDGVGDTSYNITSDGSKQDKYPLMSPDHR
ncbi:MAG TPA: NosD domain-containing protein [Candidatus Thermoplasmatota archaeon]|nr:NosD domain-containing protein [Candidatus Thermoplasmatota archaeon]